jgi:hypothetical protein
VLTAGNEEAANDGGAQFVNGTATIEQAGPDGVLVSGQLRTGTAINVVEAQALVGRPVDGDFVVDLVFPAVVGAGGVDAVQASWDYRTVVLTDGSRQVIGTTALQGQELGLRGFMPLTYIDGAGNRSEIQMQIQLDGAGGIQYVAFFEVSSGAWAPFEPAEGDQLLPRVTVERGGSVVTEDADAEPFVVGPGLRAAFAPRAAGEPFRFALRVSDVGRNVSNASVDGTVQ